jgi:hypothetical protein
MVDGLMASIEFDCPHCSRRFELENPRPGGYVPCPLCGQTVAIPADLPETSPPDAESAKSQRSPASESLVVRLSREEKQRRRQIRSLAWMIGGAVLLAVAAILLSQL